MAVRIDRVTLSAPSPSEVRHDAGEGDWLMVQAVGPLGLVPSLVESTDTPEQVLGRHMAADNQRRSGAGAEAPVVSAQAPAAAGWPARAAQRVGGSDLVLYYARPAGAGRQVMVRVVDHGEQEVSPLVRGEVLRLLASLRVDGEPGAPGVQSGR